MMRSGYKHRGFTLVEALVAIAVMAVLIPILMSGLGLAERISGRTRDMSNATALGQSHMEEIIATNAWYNGGAMNGTEHIGVRDFQWSATVGPWQDDPNLETLSVTVAWLDSVNNRQQINLVSLIYQPGAAAEQANPSGGITGGIGGLP